MIPLLMGAVLGLNAASFNAGYLEVENTPEPYPVAYNALYSVGNVEQVDSSSNSIKRPITQNPTPREVLDYMLQVFGDKMPTAYAISTCESTLRQYDEHGYVLRGKVNQKDVGIMQISETYWLDTSIKLGYDIYTYKGNIKMAKYIYDKYNFEPWSASSDCWGKL